MLCKNCRVKQAFKYSLYSSGNFCSRQCARAFATKEKRNEINIKVSKKLKKYPDDDFFVTKQVELYEILFET